MNKETNMSVPTVEVEATLCISLPALKHKQMLHIVALACRQEDGPSVRKMKDERQRAKKCVVKLILM